MVYAAHNIRHRRPLAIHGRVRMLIVGLPGGIRLNQPILWLVIQFPHGLEELWGDCSGTLGGFTSSSLAEGDYQCKKVRAIATYLTPLQSDDIGGHCPRNRGIAMRIAVLIDCPC
jgi:hypothetical protein